MTEPGMLHLRRGKSADQPAVDALLQCNEMMTGIDPVSCWIAERDGCLLGFACLEEIEGCAYLRPIVVGAEAQHQGVGRRLIRHLLSRQAQVRVVARGSARGFYEKLGFSAISWRDIPWRLVYECQTCEAAAACRPAPMESRGKI